MTHVEVIDSYWSATVAEPYLLAFTLLQPQPDLARLRDLARG